MSALFTIILGGAVLFFYARFEKRINQGICLECGAKISLDDGEGKCPDCGSFIEYEKDI